MKHIHTFTHSYIHTFIHSHAGHYLQQADRLCMPAEAEAEADRLCMPADAEAEAWFVEATP